MTAFLRRCIFHYIEFPDPDLMQEIVLVHFPDIEDNLIREGLKQFYFLRQFDEFRKKPSTSELLDWFQALRAGGISAKKIEQEIPFLGVLLKKEADVEYFEAAKTGTHGQRSSFFRRY